MTKRFFDFVFSIFFLFILGVFILFFTLISSFDTNSWGIFAQPRIGQYGKIFIIYKIKTINPKTNRSSKLGLFFRRYRIDEWPQLWNVLIGEMSFVGPRPDIEGYYDRLQGEERKLLELKPGITSEAALKYSNENKILNMQPDPKVYNDTVVFPDKVKMNLDYYYNKTILLDIKIIVKTLIKIL